MFDLKILSVKDLLPISGAQYANITPRSLLVEGERFLEATHVVINDIQAPEFIVVSDSKLMAQVPASEVNNILRKLVVLAEKPSPSRKSIFSFEVGTTFSVIQGIERMVQLFIKVLFQTPGSDRFDPSTGGGLMTLVGKTTSRGTGKSLQAQSLAMVNRARDQVIAIQAKNTRIPADERLLSAQVEQAGFDQNTTTLFLRVLLTALSGKQATANLSF